MTEESSNFVFEIVAVVAVVVVVVVSSSVAVISVIITVISDRSVPVSSVVVPPVVMPLSSSSLVSIMGMVAVAVSLVVVAAAASVVAVAVTGTGTWGGASIELPGSVSLSCLDKNRQDDGVVRPRGCSLFHREEIYEAVFVIHFATASKDGKGLPCPWDEELYPVRASKPAQGSHQASGDFPYHIGITSIETVLKILPVGVEEDFSPEINFFEMVTYCAFILRSGRFPAFGVVKYRDLK